MLCALRDLRLQARSYLAKGNAPPEVRNGAARMRNDVANRRVALECSAVEQIHNGARRVEDEFAKRTRNMQPGGIAAWRHGGRMDEDDRGAALELLEQDLVARIAQIAIPLAREQHDAIEAELIESILELAQRCVDVRQRQRREPAKMRGIVVHDASEELVAVPGELHGHCVVAPVDARRNRGHCAGNAMALHRLVGEIQAPLRDFGTAGPLDAELVQLRDEARRKY